jgi:hypothetical protein
MDPASIINFLSNEEPRACHRVLHSEIKIYLKMGIKFPEFTQKPQFSYKLVSVKIMVSQRKHWRFL